MRLSKSMVQHDHRDAMVQHDHREAMVQHDHREAMEQRFGQAWQQIVEKSETLHY